MYRPLTEVIALCLYPGRVGEKQTSLPLIHSSTQDKINLDHRQIDQNVLGMWALLAEIEVFSSLTNSE